MAYGEPQLLSIDVDADFQEACIDVSFRVFMGRQLRPLEEEVPAITQAIKNAMTEVVQQQPNQGTTYIGPDKRKEQSFGSQEEKEGTTKR